MEGKAIARLVSPMKQLKIIKKDQQVFSALKFEALPNEVITHVFSYLKIVDLLKCGQLSKRFRVISNDDNLWPKSLNLWRPKCLNLCRRKVGLIAGDQGLIRKII